MHLPSSTPERRPFAVKRSRRARRRIMVFWETLPVVIFVAGMVASLYLVG